jgi:hypothetical protein
MNEAVMKKYSLFDTLAYAKELISAGFTEKQAEVLAKKQVELLEEQTERLKEKAELFEERLATKKDLELSLAKQKVDLELSLAKQKAEMIKWMFGALTAQAIFVISIIKLF